MFDITPKQVLNCGILAIVKIGFDILNHESGRRFAFVSGPFFMPWVYQFHLRVNKLVGWVRGASARWVCSCDQYVNSHSARLFPFDIGIGGYSQGAIIMANTQEKSLEETIQKLKIECLDTAGIGAESMNWLNTLFASISEKSDRLSDVKFLADIGLFLTDMNASTFEQTIERMNKGASA